MQRISSFARFFTFAGVALLTLNSLILPVGMVHYSSDSFQDIVRDEGL
jgi:hypothetical protein